MAIHIARREFVVRFGSAAAAWPVAARAQQSDRVRVIGWLNILAKDDPEAQLRIAAFKRGLQQLGWSEGSTFWTHGDQMNGHLVQARYSSYEHAAMDALPRPELFVTCITHTSAPIKITESAQTRWVPGLSSSCLSSNWQSLISVNAIRAYGEIHSIPTRG